MALLEPDGPPHRVLLWGGLLPGLLYLATTSPTGFWLDSGEFVAASVWLGVAHPPGQPLHALTGQLASRLPLGPLAWRVGLGSALAQAVACWLLAVAAWRTLGFGNLSGRARSALSLTVAWSVGASAGWWLQAVRPEVYALQAALGLALLERLLAFEQAWPARLHGAALRQAALLFGLSLGNHHFLGLLLLPAAAPSLARFLAVRRTRGALSLLPFAAAGLGVYGYLPLRAGAPLALGQPDAPDRFWWVVSAEAFQGNVGDAVPKPLAERFADVAVLLAEDFSVVAPLLLLLGLYLALRTGRGRRMLLPWALWTLLALAARAWLGFVRENPDALGYLQGAWAGAVVLLLVGLLAAVAARPRPQQGALAWSLVVLTLAATAWTLPERAARAALPRFAETDPFDELLRRRLPSRAVSLLYAPQSVFRDWALQAEELSRPDVRSVPVPFTSYPGLAERLARQAPSLHATLAEVVLRGAPSLPTLQSLAALRPVHVELDPRVPRALDASLLAEGLLASALAEEASEGDRRLATARHLRRMRTLRRLLGPGPLSPQTEARLLWRHYVDALHLAAVGQLEAARWSARQGLALRPEARELRALLAALQGADGPLDVTPFTVGAEPEPSPESD